jgi:hypothetical protein
MARTVNRWTGWKNTSRIDRTENGKKTKGKRTCYTGALQVTGRVDLLLLALIQAGDVWQAARG